MSPARLVFKERIGKFLAEPFTQIGGQRFRGRNGSGARGRNDRTVRRAGRSSRRHEGAQTDKDQNPFRLSHSLAPERGCFLKPICVQPIVAFGNKASWEMGHKLGAYISLI